MEVVMTCKAAVISSPPTNQCSTFYRPDALPVTKPTVSEHWRERLDWLNKKRNLVCTWVLIILWWFCWWQCYYYKFITVVQGLKDWTEIFWPCWLGLEGVWSVKTIWLLLMFFWRDMFIDSLYRGQLNDNGVFMCMHVCVHLCVKDLSRLGRELNQVVIIDNSPMSYMFHPQNAVSSKILCRFISHLPVHHRHSHHSHHQTRCFTLPAHVQNLSLPQIFTTRLQTQSCLEDAPSIPRGR